MWRGRDPFDRDNLPLGAFLSLLGLSFGALMLVLGAGNLWDRSDAAGLPQLRMTVASCRAVPTLLKHDHGPDFTCEGRVADGPSGGAAEQWHLDTPHVLRSGQVVNVRCTHNGSCRTGLDDWGLSGVLQLTFGLLLFAAGGHTGSRVLVNRYVPWHDDFYRRRATVVTTLVVFFAIVAGGTIVAVLL
ncbi:hypothetical protein ACFV4P_22985 [Kitasatospora sp. NPDC059795]|uniref:hypothetical protein n=1 Tax=Kitasatospora sp. NPDC059795 TaxID=3346949 RepID=UPI003646CEFF